MENLDKPAWLDPPNPRGRCKVTATVIKRGRSPYGGYSKDHSTFGYKERETMVVKDTHGNVIWAKIPRRWWNPDDVKVGDTITFWGIFQKGKNDMIYALNITGHKADN